MKRILMAGAVAALFAAATVAALPARAATLDTFDTVVTGPTEAPGVWYTDRYNPSGFSSANFNGDNRLKVDIAKTDYQGAGSFYNTQGRAFDLLPGSKFAQIQLYMDASWMSDPTRITGLWGVGSDGSPNVSSYPIIEWANGQLQGWDSAGSWIALGTGGATAGNWLTIGFGLDTANNKIDYFANGVLVGMADAYGTTSLKSVIVQAINNNADATYYYDNLATSTSNTPLPPALAMFGSVLGLGGLGGYLKRRKRKQGASALAAAA
jgi:hypothetical protein